MTKDQHQKELKEKVKPGVKPSDFRKLKKSKSASDIPQAPPSPNSVPLTKSKSNQAPEVKYPYTQLISQQQELDKLQKATTAKSDTISLLRKKITELESQLKNNPPTQLLHDQLTQKQQELESLRWELATKNSQLTQTQTELDTALQVRRNSLRDWWTQYSKNKQLDEELTENIDQASTELIQQDQTITDLQSEVRKLKLTNQQLQKDLDLTQRVNQLRTNSWPTPPADNSYLNNVFIGLFLTIWFITLLNNSWQPQIQSEHE